MSRNGKCLCGEVSFSVEPMPTMQACHCDTCRTWGGGPFLSTPCKDAKFVGPVTSYASSDHAERGFCAKCGTHLFFWAKKPNIHAVPIGLFEDQSGLPFRAELYIDRKPAYYAFQNDTKKITGEEYETKFR